MDKVRDYLRRFTLTPTSEAEARSAEAYDLDSGKYASPRTGSIPIFSSTATSTTTSRRHPLDRYAASGNDSWWHRLRSDLRPSKEQQTILTLLGIMLIVIIIGYQFWITRVMLYPFAILSTIFHEFGHAFMALLTGARMHSITIQMDESGATRFSGGHHCLILPAGYIGSTLMGALLLFMGFGYRTSKYVSLGVVVILLLTLWFAGNLFALFSSLALGAMLLVAFFYKDGAYTRHYVLFLGVICSMEAILAILNGTVFHTIKESDAYVFSQQCSFLLPSFVYGLLWFLISLALVFFAIVSALIFYKK